MLYLSRIGSKNAAVLPDPVHELACTSLPAIINGTNSCYILVGFSNPISPNAFIRHFPSFNYWNSISVNIVYPFYAFFNYYSNFYSSSSDSTTAARTNNYLFTLALLVYLLIFYCNVVAPCNDCSVFLIILSLIFTYSTLTAYFSIGVNRPS